MKVCISPTDELKNCFHLTGPRPVVPKLPMLLKTACCVCAWIVPDLDIGDEGKAGTDNGHSRKHR